jgi:hypothetical protein
MLNFLVDPYDAFIEARENIGDISHAYLILQYTNTTRQGNQIIQEHYFASQYSYIRPYDPNKDQGEPPYKRQVIETFKLDDCDTLLEAIQTCNSHFENLLKDVPQT